jgi:hypothetical protein
MILSGSWPEGQGLHQVVSELDSICILQAEEAERRKYSDTHQFGIRGSLQRQAEGRQSVGNSVVIVCR